MSDWYPATHVYPCYLWKQSAKSSEKTVSYNLNISVRMAGQKPGTWIICSSLKTRIRIVHNFQQLFACGKRVFTDDDVSRLCWDVLHPARKNVVWWYQEWMEIMLCIMVGLFEQPHRSCNLITSAIHSYFLGQNWGEKKNLPDTKDSKLSPG